MHDQTFLSPSNSFSSHYLIPRFSAMATTTPSPLTRNYTFTASRFSFTSPKLSQPQRPQIFHSVPAPPLNHHFSVPPWCTAISDSQRANLTCKATQVPSVSDEESQSSGGGGEVVMNWVPVVPLATLPKGERRVIIRDGEEILLLWYKDQVFAIENRSPAEGAYTEGLLNAKLTQDGCIVCPTTDSTFDLRTGEIKEWYPKNPVLRALTPALRTLYIYPIKTDKQNIYISMGGGGKSDASSEIVFSGKAQPGVTASDVNVEEVKMIVDEDGGGFGFTRENELINGKAAAIGFLLLIDFELLTGKGLLKGTGFLDFIYSVSNAFK